MKVDLKTGENKINLFPDNILFKLDLGKVAFQVTFDFLWLNIKI